MTSKQKSAKELRENRLENALRANLLRRKNQSRARETEIESATPQALDKKETNPPDRVPSKG